jgi:hypothetical protein
MVPPKAGSSWAGARFRLEDAVIGRVERVCDGVLSGWAFKPDEPGWNAGLRVLVDGAQVAEARADVARPELAAAGLADGRGGFRVDLPVELARQATHSLRVETASGVPIPASPSFMTVAAENGTLWGGVEFYVPGAVIGRVEKASDGLITGWAHRSGAATWRVWMRVIVDGVEACSGVADLDRPDLAAAGIGDGRHGFRFEVPAVVSEDHPHRVLVEAEGTALLRGE